MSGALRRAAWFARRAQRRVVGDFCRRFYRDPGGDGLPTAIVSGSGRSGTTWIAEIIDSQIPCRVMFEPFNPDLVPEFRGYEYFQYMRPETDDPALLAYCRRVVRGELRNRWVDSHVARVFPRLRLIKEIRATAMLRWFADRFPEVPILFVIRHPCAVVHSRLRLGWDAERDIASFLAQPDLLADHLRPFVDIIDAGRTPEERHAIVWCVTNLVPLRQLAAGRFTPLYYESLCAEAATEVPRIFEALGVGFDRRVFSALHRPSRTTRNFSAVITGRNEVGGWQTGLSSEQIDRILGVVRAFGLDRLYGDSTRPRIADPTDL